MGTGQDRAALAHLAGELGLGDRVVFTGAVRDADLQNLYALATVFVHPSLYEGSSLVTLEALAHARPVVASAVGYIPDKVRPGVTGLLVPPADPAALAAAIAWCLAHPAEAAALGAAGAALVRGRVHLARRRPGARLRSMKKWLGVRGWGLGIRD